MEWNQYVSRILPKIRAKNAQSGALENGQVSIYINTRNPFSSGQEHRYNL